MSETDWESAVSKFFQFSKKVIDIRSFLPLIMDIFLQIMVRQFPHDYSDWPWGTQACPG